MSPRRILGIVLFVVGVYLFIMGMNTSRSGVDMNAPHSLADEVSKTFTGRFTQATEARMWYRQAATWFIVSGFGATIVGLLMALMGPRRKSA